MFRRLLITLMLLISIVFSLEVSPVLAEKQYSQTKQSYGQTEPSIKQEPYSQTKQSYGQTEPSIKQEPYSQTKQSYGQTESESE